MNNTNDNLEVLFDNIEKMIDYQDDIWHEEQHENYRWADKIRLEQYQPAKETARQAFENAVKDVVTKMLEKQK